MRPLPEEKLLEVSKLGGTDSGAPEKVSSEDPPCATEENLHAIFVRYSKSVLSFIHTLVRDRSLAEELCQETFIRAFRKLDSRDGQAALSTWLFGIARNVVREAVKSKYRDLRSVALGDPLAQRLEAAVLRPDQQLISGELHNRIQAALEDLTEDQRLVFVLKVIHKLKYEQIACITGASIAKLKTDLHRARSGMRQRLHSYLYSNNF